MPAASLRLPPAPEHVRTARLVAVAAARRSGLAEDVVDDVRLAVGEAVARAVLRQQAAGAGADVELVLRDDHAFVVEVRDSAGADRPEEDDGVALALVRALAPEAVLDGAVLRLAWPVPTA